MHVDAFFEYLLGKEHAYFLDVPHPSNPYPPNGRDGVPVEEDTALRALDPSFKPKRGRRRASETEQDMMEEKPKNARLLGAFASEGQPQSAYPRAGSAMPTSAHPDGQQHDPWTAASAISHQQFAPWSSTQSTQSAITPSVPHHLRWQAHAGSSLTPATPHPMTALPGGSMASHIDAAFSDEPKSAITPSAKRRRRHGPAVSSAWSSQNAPGKPRGRPPASRTTQDGLFPRFLPILVPAARYHIKMLNRPLETRWHLKCSLRRARPQSTTQTLAAGPAAHGRSSPTSNSSATDSGSQWRPRSSRT